MPLFSILYCIKKNNFKINKDDSPNQPKDNKFLSQEFDTIIIERQVQIIFETTNKIKEEIR